jgi:protein TonB
MFEDALLESSSRSRSVLRRAHYVISVFAGTVIFAMGMGLMPMLIVPEDQRALLIAAALAGLFGALYALMLCYVRADARQQRSRAWPWLGLTLFLNLPGFLIYLVYSARKTGDWKRASIPLAYVAESLAVGVLILIPLIYTQALPQRLLSAEIYPPAPPPAPPPQPLTPPAPAPHPTVNPFVAPAIIPQSIAHLVEAPQPPPVEVGPSGPYVSGSLPEGGLSGVIGGVPGATQAPPPAPAPRPVPKQQVIRRPSDLTAALALYQPKPIYPPLALMARVQGTVVLQAVLSKDGSVQDLKVVSGHPLLVRAALDAVRIWRYKPTTLNGEAVEVLTEIDVNFMLGQ